jgi:hypothetical protein
VANEEEQLEKGDRYPQREGETREGWGEEFEKEGEREMTQVH